MNKGFMISIGTYRKLVLKFAYVPILFFLIFPYFSTSDDFYLYFIYTIFAYAVVDIIISIVQLKLKLIDTDEMIYRYGYFFLILLIPIVSYVLLIVLMTTGAH